MNDLNVITALQEGLCTGARVAGVIIALLTAVLIIGGVTALVAMTAIELGKKDEDVEESETPRDEEGEPIQPAPRHITRPPIPSRR